MLSNVNAFITKRIKTTSNVKFVFDFYFALLVLFKYETRP